MKHKTVAIIGSILIVLLLGLIEQEGGTIQSEVPGLDETNVLVIDVVDGDTIKVKGAETKTVRLIGIDTPETKHPSKAVQCFGKEATAKLEALLLNKTVTLEKDSSEVDRYGRLLRYVYLDGEFVNELMVQEGYAFESAYEPDTKYQELFEEAENYAKTNKRGLWNEETCAGEV